MSFHSISFTIIFSFSIYHNFEVLSVTSFSCSGFEFGAEICGKNDIWRSDLL
jgi:hypothetical protein